MAAPESSVVATGEATIRIERSGSGPPLLLLHGFPQTLVMWRDIAPALAERFSVVCADLRGYGGSGCPPSAGDHAAYSKRALARDMVAVMSRLGFERFSIAGHDRGGRVAYRAALDHPDRIERLAVLDVVPIEDAWDRADDRLALGFWPWSLLAQAEPLPERLVGAAAEAGIDREHDRADRTSGRRIICPVLVLWSATGPLGSWYVEDGGPLTIWRELADDVTGRPVEGGHFFPEEHPHATADSLTAFFSSADGV